MLMREVLLPRGAFGLAPPGFLITAPGARAQFMRRVAAA